MRRCFDFELHVVILADASAAVGLIARKSLGKDRHFDTDHIWIYEVAAGRAAILQKEHDVENVVDLATQKFAASDIERHVGMPGASGGPSRHCCNGGRIPCRSLG